MAGRENARERRSINANKKSKILNNSPEKRNKLLTNNKPEQKIMKEKKGEIPKIIIRNAIADIISMLPKTFNANIQ
ncbi:MAG: hypothetical protein AABW80_03490 [Nanoarchaeota archaeon]